MIKLLEFSIGIAVSLLIMLYVVHQWSFDSFHTKRDWIYSMIMESHRGDLVDNSAVATAESGLSLREKFPGASNFVRLTNLRDAYFISGEKSRQLKDVIFADSSLFNIFSFPLSRGNPERTLRDPFTILLTESTAKHLFGDEDLNGKVLKYNGKYNFKVTGITKDPPANSHIFLVRFCHFLHFMR